MIKRPIDTRFREAILADQKTTTIRSKPWPVGKPIMLYSWTGSPYRSKQVDVAIIIVERSDEIKITHRIDGGLIYDIPLELRRRAQLHQTEGFAVGWQMDEWFRKVVKPGATATLHLMQFKRLAKTISEGIDIHVWPPVVITPA